MAPLHRATDRHDHGERQGVSRHAFENNLRRERQLEGIAKAKVAGVYTQGRPKSVDDEKIRLLHAGGKRVRKIVKELKCSRASIYLAIEAPIAKPRIQPRAAA